MTNPTEFDYVSRKLQETRGRWTDAADGSGVPASTIRKIAQGRVKNPRYETVKALFAYFQRLDQFQAQNAAARHPVAAEAAQ
ncbi:hypothetical protein [Herbaspirillum seropedicae]|uniref:hypothetical protein n=1 Tax=Herbaspirillum seropedicae TaxID=964 RepID=UPI003FCEC763